MLNYKQIYSACLVLFVIISGCSTWENFTTYFNVYYNAKLNFDLAMEDISKSEKDIFEFKEKPVSAAADKALTKVIEKCSAILQFNAESAYFDDALFIIGIAYYYKQNYSKALRKFRELEAVEETDLSLENKLWIGKTELQLRNFDEGIKVLDEVKQLASEEDNTEILESAYQTQIAFNFFQENYEDAVEIINNFLQESENEETKAEVAFQLGKIYIELNNFDKAADAFNSVMNYEPTIKTEFQSKMELAKTKRMLEDYESSLNILRELKAEDKFKQYSDVIVYQLGVTFLKEDKLEDATENFLTVDTMKVLSEKETAGLARIKLGELWEFDYMQYDSAAKYYTKAASSILTPDEKSYSISKLTLFKNYNKLSKNIYKNGRQLAYINDPQEFVKDSIDYEDYLFELKQDSLNIGNNNQTEGSTFNRERGRTAAQIRGNAQLEEQRFKPVRTNLTGDSLITLISRDKYDLGNMFFIELNVPDSAYYYYKDVLDNYPPRPFTPNVIFALGSYYLTQNDTLKADSIFQYIYDEYQGLNVADQAANRLGIIEFDVKTDSSALLYLDAENKLLDNNYSDAIESFYTLADKFPESVLAPKALYSAGWILENELKNLDSAAVVFDTLYNRYEKSLYAKDISIQLQEYKREKLQKKIEDSIKVKAKSLPDSSQIKKKLINEKREKINAKPGELLKEEQKNKSIQVDSSKSKEVDRKALFLKEEKEQLNLDSSNVKIKRKILDDPELEKDSTIIPDSGKTKIKTLLK